MDAAGDVCERGAITKLCATRFVVEGCTETLVPKRSDDIVVPGSRPTRIGSDGPGPRSAGGAEPETGRIGTRVRRDRRLADVSWVRIYHVVPLTLRHSPFAAQLDLDSSTEFDER